MHPRFYPPLTLILQPFPLVAESHGRNTLPWLKSSEKEIIGLGEEDGGRGEQPEGCKEDDPSGNRTESAKDKEGFKDMAERLQYLAPLMDRLGRLLTDSATHASQLGEIVEKLGNKGEEEESDEEEGGKTACKISQGY